MQQLMQKELEKSGFVIVGHHSGCKTCLWTKNAIIGKGMCYKGKFYGIQSHRCIQMTPNFICNAQCVFCWRDLSRHTAKSMDGMIDPPSLIIDGCIEAQRKLLSGFGGHTNKIANRYDESKDPWHFAISLDGEPTLYKHLPEMIEELHRRKITSMVVSNGYQPDVIAKIQPTQLYISVDAPTKEVFLAVDRPLLSNAWERLCKTFDLLPTHPSRTVLRMTIIKGINNSLPEEWGRIIQRAQPLFVEVKSYMHVGQSRERLEKENMMTHEEVREFSLQIAKASGYIIVDESPVSRVVLLMKEMDDKRRFLKVLR